MRTFSPTARAYARLWDLQQRNLRWEIRSVEEVSA